MTRKTTATTTRRALLGASTAGLLARSDAAMGQPPGSAATSRGGTGDARSTAADRKVLAMWPDIALGTRVQLTEDKRGGEFVARPAAAWAVRMGADPYQAFCVMSSVDNRIAWVREYTGPASLDWGGAQGDGTTDDARFINAMLQNPDVNWFQIEDRRTHFLAAPLRITRPITLTGAGIAGSVLAVLGPIDVIDAALPGPADYGLKLADFAIVNRMQYELVKAGNGIRLANAYLAQLSNIRITGCWNAVHATRSGLSNFAGLHVNRSVNAGLLFTGGDNFDTRVSGFTISDGKYAIRLEDMCDEMIFVDGVCSSARIALSTDAAVNVVNRRPEFCRFSRVSFDSCGHGLDLANCADFVFDGCFVSCRPGHGASLGVRGPVENIQFIATTFFNNARSAAVVGAHAAETDFISCKFISNGTLKANSDDTLVFAEGGGSFAVLHCRFRQGWDVASTPRYQIRIGRGGAGDYTLTGNRIMSGGTGTVLDEREGAQRQISGNSGR